MISDFKFAEIESISVLFVVSLSITKYQSQIQIFQRVNVAQTIFVSFFTKCEFLISVKNKKICSSLLFCDKKDPTIFQERR